MQETLITFETAKLAKEKGFDIPLKSGYFGDFGELDGDDYPFLGTYSYIKGDLLCDNSNNYQIVRPTQSILQKWLRETYLIQIDVVAFYDEEQLPLHKDNIQKPKGYFFWNYYDEDFSESKAIKFETYEEALELGLQESIKLIKNNESGEV